MININNKLKPKINLVFTAHTPEIFFLIIHFLKLWFILNILKQHDMNDVTGTIVTLENGQTYQLPQYHMGATIFQRAEDMVSS